MIVLAVNKESKKVFGDIQDCQHVPTPGARARAAAARTKTSPDDWFEYTVPADQTANIMNAKRLSWRKRDETVVAVPFSGKERRKKKRDERREGAEEDLLDTALKADKARELGLTDKADRLDAKVNKLKAQLAEIQAQEEADA